LEPKPQKSSGAPSTRPTSARLCPLRPQPSFASDPLQPASATAAHCRRQAGSTRHPPPPAVSTSDSTAPPKSTPRTHLPRRGPHTKDCPALLKAAPPPVSPQPNPRSHPSSCAPPPANPRCRRALFASPPHPDQRGAVQKLREIESKQLVPRVCVADPYIAGTPSPELHRHRQLPLRVVSCRRRW
jgi:hypothetical protein